MAGGSVIRSQRVSVRLILKPTWTLESLDLKYADQVNHPHRVPTKTENQFSMSRIRIGAVSYLNTKPLVYGLAESDDRFEVVFDLPSRLADRLAANELDVALIPVIEAVSNPVYTIVSDACIACRGPVRSVKLFSNCLLYTSPSPRDRG